MYDNRDGGSNFADRSYGPTQDKPMFRATCDQCGESCEVPFRPTNGKPVLCSNCFAATKTDGGRRVGKDNNPELEEINAKLDKILKLLSPVSGKEASKEITMKILEEIETNLEKTPSVGKKRVKKVVKK
jgi:CxxC-x17-CxxC domain-containing protein